MSIELRRRLHIVDPNLKIVHGHCRRAIHGTTIEDWEKAGGTLCPQCGGETVRLREVSSSRKVCPQCFQDHAKKMAKREASLSALINSRDRGLARRARKFLDRLNNRGG